MRRITTFLAATALVGFCLLGLLLPAPAAIAAVRQVEEAPGQMVYQSRQTLRDQHGDRWQMIAFYRIRPDGKTNFDLRIVGFPGKAEIDRTRSLKLTSSLGDQWFAADDSAQMFTDATSPEPYIGQYDIQPVVPDLEVFDPLQLNLPLSDREDAELSIAPTLLREWQSLIHQ